MPHLEFTVADHEAGRRVDLVVSQRYDDLSRVQIQRLLALGHLCVNNQRVAKGHALSLGDVVHGEWSDAKTEPLPQAMALDFLYQDADILVINKPANLTIHPGSGTPDGTLVNALLAHDEAAFTAMWDEKNQRPGIVHRLDKDTTGVLVVARHEEARQALAEQFQERTVGKQYLALVDGVPAVKEQTVESFIGRHPRNRKKMAVVDGGKEARSHWALLRATDSHALLKVDIHSGRTHQIRVHLAHCQLPVVGDSLYGLRQPPMAAPRQMLHAWKLSCRHPISNEAMEFVAKPPADWLETAARLGFSTSDLK